MHQIITLISLFIGLQCFASHYQLETIEYGKSELNNKLLAYKFFKADQKHDRYILITEAIHGNEVTGTVSSLKEMFKAQKFNVHYQQFLNAGGVLLLVPTMNPDGVQLNSRFNARGVDLNRHFQTQKEPIEFPEVSSLQAFVESELQKNKAKLVMSIDYHCCARKLLYVENTLTNTDQKLVNQILVETLGSEYSLATTQQTFGDHLPGTQKNYLFQRYGTLAFTFEGEFFDDKKEERATSSWLFLSKMISTASHLSYGTNPSMERSEESHLSLTNVNYSE